ncbi:MAG: hypothetical protein GY827_04650 [Cytophagales bacterium]|nr:hypothetical protein [Cytophagales bacterium]
MIGWLIFGFIVCIFLFVATITTTDDENVQGIMGALFFIGAIVFFMIIISQYEMRGVDGTRKDFESGRLRTEPVYTTKIVNGDTTKTVTYKIITDSTKKSYE